MWRVLVCLQAGSENSVKVHWTSWYLIQPPPQRQHPLISVPCCWTPSLSWLQQQLPHVTPAAGGKWEFSTGMQRDSCQVHEAASWIWIHCVWIHPVCTGSKSNLSLPSQLCEQCKWPLFQKLVLYFEWRHCQPWRTPKPACSNKIIFLFPAFCHKHTEKELLCTM